ncbi:MAG: hypothetical protein P1Q69_15450 [Candidatus Thorarchaeota archaeon]|nr:hypothetical protein [Candidatus Thorarchaeota archaeon]
MMSGDSAKRIQNTIQHLVSEFKDYVNGLQIPDYLTETSYFVPHYHVEKNGASLVLDQGVLYNSYKIAKEFGIRLMVNGLAEDALSSLESEIDSKYHSLEGFTKIIAGFFQKIVNRTNPLDIDQYRVQRYLPLLVQQLTTERYLEISRSLIYPFRSDMEKIELGSGVTIRRLYPDEYDDEWNKNTGEIWTKGEDKGPSTDYIFENVYPQKTIDGVFANHRSLHKLSIKIDSDASNYRIFGCWLFQINHRSSILPRCASYIKPFTWFGVSVFSTSPNLYNS